MLNFKIMTAALTGLAIANSTLLLQIVSTTKAQAFGGYARHEHAFKYIGSGYSQSNGDARCRQIYGDLGGFQASGGVTGSNFGGFGWGKVSGRAVFAYDGTLINKAWHVWYHKNQGECVANK
jgi:hypothetical protein